MDFRKHSFIHLVTGLLSLLISTVSAEAPVYIAPLGGSNNLTFAVVAPSDASYFDFHLSAPKDYSWMAVGIGKQMSGSLMLVAYQNSSGDGLTLSPRLCSAHTEPVYSSDLDVTVNSSSVVDGSMIVNARCNNCQQWKGGHQLNLLDTQQPWIFAVGPSTSLSAGMRSDSKTASIERHSEYGIFEMNMIMASSDTASLPTSYTASVGSSPKGNTSHDSNWPSIIHALAATLAFVLFMPSGVLILRLAKSNGVRLHWMNQTVSLLGAVIGTGLGLYLSPMFTKSSSFNSGHQVLGLFVAVLSILQWGIGYWHHRLYKLYQRPTMYAVGHRYLGRVVVLLGTINAGVGLNYAKASTGVVAGYSVAAAVIIVVTVVLVIWKKGSLFGKGLKRTDSLKPLTVGYEMERRDQVSPVQEMRHDSDS